MNTNQPNQQPNTTFPTSQPNNPPPSTQTPVPPETPKKKTPWFLITAIVLLLISTGALGYKYYQLQQKVNDLQQPTPQTSAQLVVSSPSPVVSPVAEVNPTANWKTYFAKQDLKDIGITYSFKYPEKWFIDDEDSSRGIFTPWVVVSENQIEITDPRTSPGIIVTGGIYPAIKGVSGVANQLDSRKLKFTPSSEEISEITVISSKNITLGEYNGIRRKITRYDTDEETTQVIIEGDENDTYGSGNKNYFIIESSPKTDSNIFNQILSTFQFTN